jgi:hypothetical protein
VFVVLFLIFPLLHLANVFREAEKLYIYSIYAGEEDERVVMRLLSRLIREANYKGEEEEKRKKRKKE